MSERPLRADKIGKAVECAVCHHTKAPLGRSVPMQLYRCERDRCEGYDQPPCPGSLWPGETEEEFGYVTCDCE